MAYRTFFGGGGGGVLGFGGCFFSWGRLFVFQLSFDIYRKKAFFLSFLFKTSSFLSLFSQVRRTNWIKSFLFCFLFFLIRWDLNCLFREQRVPQSCECELGSKSKQSWSIENSLAKGLCWGCLFWERTNERTKPIVRKKSKTEMTASVQGDKS